MTAFTNLDRLEALFAEREVELQAFLPENGRFERLRREAAVLTERYPEPGARPALFGIAVGVKDCLHVDGFPTRVGSRLPPEVLGGAEGGAVRAFKDAGALILGKTVSTEFTYFEPGPTRNPHAGGHTPGGSSSGSAAAVGAGLCPLALGTQTIGSIVRPAAFCGVVGFKATWDRIPADGAVNLAPSLDHVGFFAADLAMAERAAGVLVRDWRHVRPERRPVLGIPEGPYLEQAEPEGLEHFRGIVGRLADAGWEVRPVEVLDDFEEIRARHDLIVSAECAAIHREWFAHWRELYRPRTAELIRRGQEVSAEALEEARAGRGQLGRALHERMDEAGIDLWICPSTPGPAPEGLGYTGDPVMNLPWTQAGLPALNLPAGTNAAGLPLGVQLVGRFGADELVLAWAGDLARSW